jgi:hypothetical protein
MARCLARLNWRQTCSAACCRTGGLRRGRRGADSECRNCDNACRSGRILLQRRSLKGCDNAGDFRAEPGERARAQPRRAHAAGHRAQRMPRAWRLNPGRWGEGGHSCMSRPRQFLSRRRLRAPRQQAKRPRHAACLLSDRMGRGVVLACGGTSCAGHRCRIALNEWHGRARAWHGAFVPGRRAVLKSRANDGPCSPIDWLQARTVPHASLHAPMPRRSPSANGTVVPTPGTASSPCAASRTEKAVPRMGWARRSCFAVPVLPRGSKPNCTGSPPAPRLPMARRSPR